MRAFILLEFWTPPGAALCSHSYASVPRTMINGQTVAAAGKRIVRKWTTKEGLFGDYDYKYLFVPDIPFSKKVPKTQPFFGFLHGLSFCMLVCSFFGASYDFPVSSYLGQSRGARSDPSPFGGDKVAEILCLGSRTLAYLDKSGSERA